MSTNKTLSEAETLEMYRVSLTNAENQSQIASIIAEFGYDAPAIQKGKDLLAETRLAFNTNKREDDETLVAYKRFSILKDQLATVYALHRKKARVVFYNDVTTQSKLDIIGSMPKAYVNWLEAVIKFYEVLAADAEIQSKLARLKITPANIASSKQMISDLQMARAEYLREKGESQDTTNKKDASFAKIDSWMREFYAISRIALEENPQLLESMGKLVRN
jgi:hypothetical protein